MSWSDRYHDQARAHRERAQWLAEHDCLQQARFHHAAAQTYDRLRRQAEEFEGKQPMCTFGGEDTHQEPAVARFYLDQGCVGMREINQYQDLCLQHLHSATPVGRMVLIDDFTVEGLDALP